MNKITFSFLIGLMIIEWLPSFASDKPAVQVVFPNSLSFGFSAISHKTDCTKLDQLLEKYVRNDCAGTPTTLTRCIMDQERIIAESKHDATMENGSLDFLVQYQITDYARVTELPKAPSRQFDITYLGSVTLMAQPDTVFNIEALSGNARLIFAEKFQLTPDFRLRYLNGHPVIETNNRLYACALEAGDATLRAQVDLGITPFHPEDALREQLLAEIHHRARALTFGEQSLAAKQFLLGVSVADTFRKHHFTLSDEHELEAVAMSAYRLLLKDTPSEFTLNEDNADSQQAAREMLSPSGTISGATVKLRIKP